MSTDGSSLPSSSMTLGAMYEEQCRQHSVKSSRFFVAFLESRSLAMARQLVVLQLKDTYLGDGSMLPLSSILSELSSLRGLGLASNGIGNSGVKNLCTMLDRKTTTPTTAISSSPSTSTWQSVPNLTTIDLSDNPSMTRESGQTLLNTVGRRTGLCRVQLEGCRVTDYFASRIRKHCDTHFSALDVTRQLEFEAIVQELAQDRSLHQFYREDVPKEQRRSGSGIAKYRDAEERWPESVVGNDRGEEGEDERSRALVCGKSGLPLAPSSIPSPVHGGSMQNIPVLSSAMMSPPLVSTPALAEEPRRPGTSASLINPSRPSSMLASVYDEEWLPEYAEEVPDVVEEDVGRLSRPNAPSLRDFETLHSETPSFESVSRSSSAAQYSITYMRHRGRTVYSHRTPTPYNMFALPPEATAETSTSVDVGSSLQQSTSGSAASGSGVQQLTLDQLFGMVTDFKPRDIELPSKLLFPGRIDYLPAVHNPDPYIYPSLPKLPPLSAEFAKRLSDNTATASPSVVSASAQPTASAAAPSAAPPSQSTFWTFIGTAQNNNPAAAEEVPSDGVNASPERAERRFRPSSAFNLNDTVSEEPRSPFTFVGLAPELAAELGAPELEAGPELSANSDSSPRRESQPAACAAAPTPGNRDLAPIDTSASTGGALAHPSSPTPVWGRKLPPVPGAFVPFPVVLDDSSQNQRPEPEIGGSPLSPAIEAEPGADACEGELSDEDAEDGTMGSSSTSTKLVRKEVSWPTILSELQRYPLVKVSDRLFYSCKLRDRITTSYLRRKSSESTTTPFAGKGLAQLLDDPFWNPNQPSQAGQITAYCRQHHIDVSGVSFEKFKPPAGEFREYFLHRSIKHSFTEKVTAASLDGSGNRIAFASYNVLGSIWEVTEDGVKRKANLEGHTECLSDLCWIPKRKNRLVTSSFDFTARIWDSDSAECLHVLRGHNAEIISVIPSPSGKYCATCSVDETAILWNVDTGEQVHRFAGHSYEVVTMDFDPQETKLVTGSMDSTVIIWDLQTGQQLHALQGHRGEISQVRFNCHGNQVLSSGTDETAYLWDVSTGAKKPLRGHSAGINDCNFSRDGWHCATASEDGTARVWDVISGGCVAMMVGHTAGVSRVLFETRERKELFTGSLDSTVRVWDLKDGYCKQVLRGHRGWVNVQYYPESQQLLTVGRDNICKLWRREAPQDTLLFNTALSVCQNAGLFEEMLNSAELPTTVAEYLRRVQRRLSRLAASDGIGGTASASQLAMYNDDGDGDTPAVDENGAFPDVSESDVEDGVE
jgi:dynein assembly factor with WDR repeat domains 1